MDAWPNWSPRKRRDFVLDRVRAIAKHAYNNVPFYADLYLRHGIDPQKLRHFEELAELPIVSRAMLQGVSLEERSCKFGARMLANTGGTSGQPLHFYVGPDSIPNEWAHMHDIWKRVGFRTSDLKVWFGGARLDGAVRYDSLRHSIAVDIFADWATVAEALASSPMLDKIRFLHGYPSAIFDFIGWLNCNQHPLLAKLQNSIRGLLLGSEYPAPKHRAEIEAILSCSSVSWYGQTERAVLAGESNEKYVYVPFQTYGHTEAISSDDGNGELLTGTSYFNHVSPFIRYVTGDRVTAIVDHGMVSQFRVSEGRNGDFVTTIDGKKIYLTGLIFGRHQKLFNFARFIQAEQFSPDSVRIHVVPIERMTVDNARRLFDVDGINLKFDFIIRDDPVRTPAGKVPLLIKSSYV